MPKLEAAHVANFATLERACRDGRLALLDCRDIRTGKPARVIVAVAASPDGEAYEFIPLARMFDGDPYDELNPPSPEGGYQS